MLLISNKKGMGLPAVLGIVSFLMIAVFSLLTFTLNTAKLIEKSITLSVEQNYGINTVEATVRTIIREQNLESTYLQELQNYMGVTITPLDNGLLRVSYLLTNNRAIRAYLSGSSTVQSTYDALLQYSGTEPDFSLSPFITSFSLLNAYLPEYIATNFSWIAKPDSFGSFQEMIDYIHALANDGLFQYKLPADLQNQFNPTAWYHWFVDGNVTIPKDKNLTVPDGYLLVIDGNLTMNQNSTITGNVVVNGDVKINGKGNSWQSVVGTLYVKGNFSAASRFVLGSASRPTFLLVEGSISMGTQTSGYAYLLAYSLSLSGAGNLSITGGVYIHQGSGLSAGSITPNPSINQDDLYQFAIPSHIGTEDGGSGSGGESGFIYTRPKIE